MKRFLLCAASVLPLYACSGDDTTDPDAPLTDAYLDAGELLDIAPPQDVPDPEFALQVERAWPAAFDDGVVYDECMFASPLLVDGSVIQAVGPYVVALSPDDGSVEWEVTLPAPEGEEAFVVATPVQVGDLLIVGYHTTTPSDSGRNVGDVRIRHRVAAVDLTTGALAEDMDAFDLDGEFRSNIPDAPLTFLPGNAIGRAAIAHIPTEDGLGWTYFAFGNVRDIQPWHGFLFEVDLDAWAGGAEPISGRFVSTRETDCGPAGASGSRERLCGGGLWSPGGHLVMEDEDGFSIVVAAGNGQLSIEEENFANTLIRLRPGLEFEHGCDADLCADFDPDEPSLACIESCGDLFIPRELADEPSARPENGVCDGMTMFECWQLMDYIGGSTPVEVTTAGGTRVIAYPAKDGALWLVDAENMGTMHDREQLVRVCGTMEDGCRWDWAGMIVTQPTVTELNGEPLLLVPTFMPDNSHPAGVVAVLVRDTEDGPRLEKVWQAPSFATPESVSRFRRHPTRLSLYEASNGLEVGLIAEAGAPGTAGRFMAIRAWDGEILADVGMAGPGYRFTQPLVVGDRAFVPSCQSDNGPSTLEAFDLGLVEVAQ